MWVVRVWMIPIGFERIGFPSRHYDHFGERAWESSLLYIEFTIMKGKKKRYTSQKKKEKKKEQVERQTR